jgi:hypothetical protein
VPNFLDLTHALFRLTGVEGIEMSPAAAEFAAQIGGADHYVFILVDGLGANLVEKAPEGGFLRTHVVREFQAVFPPTTAAALTTLATGLWPASHGVTGWWVYLEEFGLTATALPFTERYSEKPLGEWGVKAADLFPVPGVWGRFKHAPFTLVGAGIAESVYTTYSAGGTERAGYSSMSEAFVKAVERVRQAASPSFTYVYLPQVDSLCHERGIGHDEVAKVIAAVDARIAGLAEAVAGKARLVVTADHGLADTPEETRFVIYDDDAILEHLVCPPTCEPTMPVFHVKEGREAPFANAFRGRFGEHFALITPDDAERLELFGPVPLSAVTRPRLGTYIGIAGAPAAIHYRQRAVPRRIHIGMHAGMSSEEMRVPLILA